MVTQIESQQLFNFPLGVQSVLKILNENQVQYELRTFKTPARQAGQAADLLGCPLGAIVKSLVFQKQASGELLMVLVSGKNRADIQILNEIVGEIVQSAKPTTVLALTGYPVGAVPPIGVKGTFPVIMDADLMLQEHVWASAGAENVLIKFDPVDLLNLSKGKIEVIKQA